MQDLSVEKFAILFVIPRVKQLWNFIFRTRVAPGFLPLDVFPEFFRARVPRLYRLICSEILLLLACKHYSLNAVLPKEIASNCLFFIYFVLSRFCFFIWFLKSFARSLRISKSRLSRRKDNRVKDGLPWIVYFLLDGLGIVNHWTVS